MPTQKPSDYKRGIPIRIQRKRTKGWKMPPNTVYVGRPTFWGNPYRIGDTIRKPSVLCISPLKYGIPPQPTDYVQIKDNKDAVEWFKLLLVTSPSVLKIVKELLKGKNLACWCPLDQPCHADILLKIANNL